VDSHRHVLSWNKAAERLLGFSEAEIVGRRCDLFFTPEDVKAGVPQRELAESLLDIGMPRRKGFEACPRIREQPWGKNMVMVAVTGWGQEEDKRQATEAGLDHHLTKPVDPNVLLKLPPSWTG